MKITLVFTNGESENLVRKIRITKNNRGKIDRLTTCLDMCCMPWIIGNNYIYIHNGKYSDSQVEVEIKRVLG